MGNQFLTNISIFSSKCTRIFLVFSIIFSFYTEGSAQCSCTDCRCSDSLALVSLYDATNGANWTNNTNWKVAGRTIDTWFGVTLANGRVIKLILIGNKLTGNLPPAVGNLSELRQLALYDNLGLTGSLPSTISNLANLELLQIERCNFSGSIPNDIGRLRKLLWFHIFDNKFTDVIPNSICDLTALQSLAFYGNSFNSTIPDSIGKLINLEFFYAANARLKGKIPESFANLRKLKKLHLFKLVISPISPYLN